MQLYGSGSLRRSGKLSVSQAPADEAAQQEASSEIRENFLRKKSKKRRQVG